MAKNPNVKRTGSKKAAASAVASSGHSQKSDTIDQENSSAHDEENLREPAEDFLIPIKGPELVFGLVGPIGTNMDKASQILAEELKSVGYQTEEIHITDFYQEVDSKFDVANLPLEERYDAKIKAGNKLREKMKRADALALLSIAAIRRKRLTLTKDRRAPAENTAYILNQFKRPEEIESLRQVYGSAFIQISAYCSKQIRLDTLTKRIAENHHGEKREEYYRGTAHNLMARDEEEEEVIYGQRVRDTFPLADVIIKADNNNTIEETCSRFIKAFFGDNFITPTKDEYGAYAAKISSLRSADLSRQVGAVAMRPTGEILSVGCNEVPKCGGGTYWEGDPYDHRDFQVGYDSSVKMKTYILQDTFRRLKDSGWLKDEHENKEISNLVEEAFFHGHPPIMKESLLMNILEFGRIVHAEMSAITDAARLGHSLMGATLYCTTFPCHNCARHIVSSGIERVVYIEPYSKSLAADLYPDSIEIEGQSRMPGPKVNFEPFIGIAPQRYAEIFSKGSRKDKEGNAVKWDRTTAEPILNQIEPAYLQIEGVIVKSLEARLKKLQVQLI